VLFDVRKAYDSLDGDWLLVILRALGFAESFVTDVAHLVRKRRAALVVSGYIIGDIECDVGLEQGSALACALFIIAVAPLIDGMRAFGVTPYVLYAPIDAASRARATSYSRLDAAHRGLAETTARSDAGRADALAEARATVATAQRDVTDADAELAFVTMGYAEGSTAPADVPAASPETYARLAVRLGCDLADVADCLADLVDRQPGMQYVDDAGVVTSSAAGVERAFAFWDQLFFPATNLGNNLGKSRIILVSGVTADDFPAHLRKQIIGYDTQATRARTLGIYMDAKGRVDVDYTWSLVVARMQAAATAWRAARAPLGDRATLVHTHVLSQASYVASYLEMPPAVVKAVRRIVYSFMARGPAAARISWRVLNASKECNGLGVPDVATWANARLAFGAVRYYRAQALGRVAAWPTLPLWNAELGRLASAAGFADTPVASYSLVACAADDLALLKRECFAVRARLALDTFHPFSAAQQDADTYWRADTVQLQPMFGNAALAVTGPAAHAAPSVARSRFASYVGEMLDGSRARVALSAKLTNTLAIAFPPKAAFRAVPNPFVADVGAVCAVPLPLALGDAVMRHAVDARGAARAMPDVYVVESILDAPVEPGLAYAVVRLRDDNAAASVRVPLAALGRTHAFASPDGVSECTVPLALSYADLRDVRVACDGAARPAALPRAANRLRRSRTAAAPPPPPLPPTLDLATCRMGSLSRAFAQRHVTIKPRYSGIPPRALLDGRVLSPWQIDFALRFVHGKLYTGFTCYVCCAVLRAKVDGGASGDEDHPVGSCVLAVECARLLHRVWLGLTGDASWLDRWRSPSADAIVDPGDAAVVTHAALDGPLRDAYLYCVVVAKSALWRNHCYVCLGGNSSANAIGIANAVEAEIRLHVAARRAPWTHVLRGHHVPPPVTRAAIRAAKRRDRQWRVPPGVANAAARRPRVP